MAHTVKSRKAKGRKFQQEVAQAIQSCISLQARDVVSTPASVTGEDILLSERAKKKFPFSVECKAQENLSIWRAMQQAEDNTPDERMPLLVFKRNRSKTYCVLDFADFLELLSGVGL